MGAGAVAFGKAGSGLAVELGGDTGAGCAYATAPITEIDTAKKQRITSRYVG
jgi:hypothetical protein